MVDVDKLSDAEIRTKLLEFGFPVMPITGTTRRIMVKKLKLLLETKNKVPAADGRRSLGRYSSEEDSDTEVKAKKGKNRRITMAAPTISSSSSNATTSHTFHEPDVLNGSRIRKSEKRATVTSKSIPTTPTRSQNLINLSRDEYGTDSDSESEIASKLSQQQQEEKSKYNTSSSFNGIDIRDASSDSSRLYPQLNYASPSRNLSVGTSALTQSTKPGLSGSFASEYAADKLNQIRSRYSFGSPGIDRSSSIYSSVAGTASENLEEKDTPFLSNFTKRLSALNTSRKIDFDNRNETTATVKEHDSNGASSALAYGRSYLSSFKPKTRDRNEYYYRSTIARDNNSANGKNNLISFAVLAGAALFFVVIAFVYIGMKPDTSLITSDFITPYCNLNRNADPQYKIGFECIENENHVKNAIHLLNALIPELTKRSVTYQCSNNNPGKPTTIKPQMNEDDILTFCRSNFDIKDIDIIKNDLRNLEIMIFSNPEWGINVAQKNDNDIVTEEDIVKSIKELNANRDGKVTSLIIFNPELPYTCTLYKKLASFFYVIFGVALIFIGLLFIVWLYKWYCFYQQKRKDEVNYMVERIIEILQNAASESIDNNDNYVVINHVRDMILNVKERREKQKYWDEAIKYINENESRVRTEVQTVQGEPFDVWRWIGNANLSLSGSQNKSVWQGQAFETYPGSENQLAYSPTPCLKIRGMINEDNGLSAAAAKEALLSKVAHRCKILHCKAEPTSGCIYLKCGDAQDAAIAHKNLHGWWYSGQLVTVKYLRLERYQQRYPDAPSGPPYLISATPFVD